jgi:hypothetical protein
MVGGKMSDKNLEQRINIKFCEKIGKSASEKLALLTPQRAVLGAARHSEK